MKAPMEKSGLARFIDGWVAEHRRSHAWLAKQAGLYPSVISDISIKGSTPRPATLKRIAQAMGEPLSTLLFKAGYLSEDELDLDTYGGLDEEAARRLARFPKPVQRALVRDMLPALEKAALAIADARASYAPEGAPTDAEHHGSVSGETTD